MVTSNDKMFWVQGLGVGNTVQHKGASMPQTVLARCGHILALSREGDSQVFGNWATEDTILKWYEKPNKKEA